MKEEFIDSYGLVGDANAERYFDRIKELSE